ncbi:hypothetical protein RhiirC2_871741, partial [Rhizophagus irregularis]
MGDFNLISNGHIDRTPPQHISKPKIFNDLEAMGLIDSYRKLNKEVPGNTYHREGVSTRIDQIWISENISNNLMNFSITPLTFITHNQEVIEDKVNIKEYSQEDIDRYWDKLNSIIVSAADSKLPRKVIRLHNTFIRYNKKKTRPERHTNKLLKLLHNYYYGNQQMTTSVGAKSRWARKIAKYNQDYVTSTDDYNKCNIVIQDMFSENCILDRNTHANIVIDKVLVNEESEGSTKRLATELGEVKEAVDNDFAIMFRKRNTFENSLTPLWQQIYEPAGKFKEVMEATIEKVTMEEWNNTVKDLNKNSTAGLSGINYKIILQLPEEIVILLVKFGNLMLQVSVCAYMDDTVFLESLKSRMQKIVDIANDFYLINDIDINVKKSEMIIINPSVERHEQVIELGCDRSIVQATNNEIRYLGSSFLTNRVGGDGCN